MAHGPGKYDELATIVLGAANAEGVAVAVVNGIHGSGFSVQWRVRSPTDARAKMLLLAKSLRDIADQIERDARRMPVGES